MQTLYFFDRCLCNTLNPSRDMGPGSGSTIIPAVERGQTPESTGGNHLRGGDSMMKSSQPRDVRDPVDELRGTMDSLT